MLDFYRFEQFALHQKVLQLVSTKSHHFPYAFSLALHTGEAEDMIVSNREVFVEALAVKEPLNFIVADQVHSDTIYVIEKSQTRGWVSSLDAIAKCDALITNLPHVMLAVVTADCVPVLLYDSKKDVVAAIHAGWKGTKSEITYKCVQKMQDLFGSHPKDIIAGIAPAIGLCCYEVDEDVAKHFLHIPQATIVKKDKYMLDLPYINKVQLLNAGLDEKHIEMSHICTSCEVKHFFSYRKEKGCSGRFMSMIGLKEEV